MQQVTRARKWKMERASVHRTRARRPRSNKYSGGDTEAAPVPHARKKTWVGGHRRADGTRIKGYFRRNAQH